MLANHLTPESQSAPTVPAQEITVSMLKSWMDTQTPFLLLDVRESWELQEAAFPHYQHIPLGVLEQALEDIQTPYPIVVVCHHGRRSLVACQILHRYGMTQARSLQGGIHLWAVQINPTIKQYG